MPNVQTPEHPTRQTRWLSKGLTDLWQLPEMGPVPYWDVVIVGSGYGGSVAARSLANQLITENGVTRPLRVCLLERGKEYLPGAFPSRFADLPGHVRITQQGSAMPSGNREGLFDLRLGGDVSALVANGLGGGSLINAAVLARPDFKDTETGLPLAVSQELKETYLERATVLLGGGNSTAPNRIDRYRQTPPGQSPVTKTAALRYFSGGNQFSLARTAASMVNAPNSANVQQNECTLCGDCMTGCNVDAKNSLDTNLLATAAQGGVQIFTGASVLKLARDELDRDGLDRDGLDGAGGLWFVTVVHTDNRLQAKEEAPLVLNARRVILAAGTLGSTEILLRSRSERTVFSTLLGARFSCNGDNFAVIYDSPRLVNSVADEETAAGNPNNSRRVGPTITGSVKMARVNDARPEFLIQEFSVPGPLNRFFRELATTANTIYGLSDADETIHGSSDPVYDPHAVDAAKIGSSLLVGLIGHDEAHGLISLPSVPSTRYDRNEQEGSVHISWPGLKNSPLIEQAYKRLERLFAFTPGKKASTRLIANPMWQLLPPSLADLVSQPRGPLMTVHPLGGCCMDTESAPGVVDQCGRVHNLANEAVAAKSKEKNWFGTLVVLDGSIVPGSLGANPALTITALSLRAMDFLVPHWRFKTQGAEVRPTDKPAQTRPRFVLHPMPPPTPATPTEVEVVERLSGQMCLHIGEVLPVKCVVELSLAYQSKRVSDLTTVLKRTLEVDSNNALTRLRIYEARTWRQQNLEVASDEKRRQHLLFESELSGSMSFFHRDRSMPVCRGVNSLWAYAWNRGSRDFWQYGREKVRQRLGLDPVTSSGVDFLARLFNAVALSTRAGEVRLFEYELVIGQAIVGNLIEQGSVINGHKRLTYNRRANPWQQLMELSITRMPGLCPQECPILKLDTRFLAKQGAPLLRISRQQDMVQALAELTSLGLALARVVLSTHLWTFRKPDTPSSTEPQRLPGKVVGLPGPEITELVVGLIPTTRQPVVVRLTRYPRAHSTKPPLAMIHGYSVSGNTFTHSAIDRSAAQHFWNDGRDVWVVDLRTSAGLPTAAYPWAMEDVALVDIPAALLYVRQVTGENVDVLAHCIGAVMLSMALLADAEKIRAGQTELGVDSQLTTRQLGLLASFNKRETPNAAHPCIGKIVLSQKGPLLRYSDANIFRSYMLGFLRRALVGAGYQFRASAKPTVADQLLDRLLASIPYPASDYDQENPITPWKTTPWVGSRHRMDALYARDFSAKNLNHATLNAIDDLFGPINVDTVAQTMHFARFCRATNQRGRGEFVTLGNLRERWGGIPTLAIHGDDNGLVDVSTQSLLGVNFTAAGVPFACKSYRGLGHQDVLIGKSSSVVFNDIEDFLNHPPQRNSANTSDLQQWFLDVPWMGPRLRVPLVGETLSSSIACMSSPAFGESTLMLIAVDIAMHLVPGVRLVTGDTGSNGTWLFAPPSGNGAGEGAASPYGWIAILAYRASEITLSEQEQVAGDNTPQQPGTPRAPRVGRAVIPDPTTYSHLVVGKHSTQFASILESAANLSTGTNQLAPDTEPGVEVLQDWLQYMHQHRPNDLAKCLVRRDDWVRAISRKSVGKKSELRFALGSCQYPAGLLDKRVALASLARLGGELDKRDFVIFAGDQIYADATAGLLDPTRRDELFDQPYEAALRKPAMRTVLSRVPVYMLLDDHEIRDNWEPVATPARRLNDPREDEDVLNNGVAAYMHYQRMHERNNASRVIGFQVSHALAEFYFLDARTQRELRSSTTLGSANIISQQQLNDLRVWLEANANKPKFIVTASLFLPRRLAVAQTPSDAARSDAWDGYSASIASVLQIIVTAKVKNVVFLSGDEHHSMFAETRLVDTSAPGSEPIEITTVHSSGLYAPFPFANGAPQDFEAIDVLNFGTWTATTVTRFAPGDGFAQIRLRRENGAWTLNVDFKKPGGATVSFNTRLA